MMLVISIILALGFVAVSIHFLCRLVAKCRVYPKLCIFGASTLLGVVLGVITVVVPNDSAREFLNPFGVLLASWIDGSWNLGGLWTTGYPQTYFFTTLFLYAALGLFITIGFLMKRVDMSRHFGSTSRDV